MTERRALVAVLACLAALAAPPGASAQLTENLGGLTDENIPGYLAPLNTGLSGTMNAAIFRTGRVPKAGVNISGGIVIMAIGFDDEDKTYVPTDPEGFTSLEPTEVPTVIGDPAGAQVAGEGGLTQQYPGGFDLEGFEIAAPQISIGSVFGTRAVIRYVAFDLGDSDLGQFSYFGVGAQHSISQWIPDLLPVDLAAGFMVQRFEIGDEIVKARTLYVGVTASKQFTYLRPYAGVGIDSIRLDGDYVDDDGQEPDLSFDFSLDRQTDPHLTLGVAADAQFVSAFVELNVAAATGVAVGLSFGN